MYSHSRFLSRHHHLLHVSHKHFSRVVSAQGRSSSFIRYRCSESCSPRFNPLIIQQYSCCGRYNVLTGAFDEGSFDLPLLDELDPDENSSGYFLSSSDGEDSDGEIVLPSLNDVDLPSISVSNKDALTVTAHRLVTLGRGHRRHRRRLGIFISLSLIIFMTVLLLYIDWCAWRIVRLPLAPFYMTRPFLISALLVAFVGYICVPFFQIFEFIQVFKKEGPVSHLLKKNVPTLGGLLFVPIGIFVTRAVGGFSSVEVTGAAGATMAFAAIGLLDDILSLTTKQKRGLPAWAKVLLEVAVGTSFSTWLDTSSISSPYAVIRRIISWFPSFWYQSGGDFGTTRDGANDRGHARHEGDDGGSNQEGGRTSNSHGYHARNHTKGKGEQQEENKGNNEPETEDEKNDNDVSSVGDKERDVWKYRKLELPIFNGEDP